MIRWLTLQTTWLFLLVLASGQYALSANGPVGHQAKGGANLIIPVAITEDRTLGKRTIEVLAREHIALSSMHSPQQRRYVLFASSRPVAGLARTALKRLQLRNGSLGLGIYREGPERDGQRAYTAIIPGTSTKHTLAVPVR